MDRTADRSIECQSYRMVQVYNCTLIVKLHGQNHTYKTSIDEHACMHAHTYTHTQRTNVTEWRCCKRQLLKNGSMCYKTDFGDKALYDVPSLSSVFTIKYSFFNPFFLKFIIPTDPLNGGARKIYKECLLWVEMVAVRILSCTFVSQKKCRSFLLFAASLAQGWRRPVWSRRRIWSWRLSVQHNVEGKEFSVYCYHPGRFVALDSVIVISSHWLA